MNAANIFQMAETNSSALEQAWKDNLEHMAEEMTDNAQEFFNHVQRYAGVTINLKPKDLKFFLDEGVYLNVYQVARNRAKQNLTRAEDELKKTLGDYYKRRTDFDSHFEGGNDFIYGALNIGCLGAVKYGDHCLVVKMENIIPRLSYLRNDSLRGDWWSGDNKLQVDRVHKALADESHKPHLAGLKHDRKASETDQSHWPGLLCNNEEYIEAIFSGGLSVQGIEAVRMLKERYDELFDHLFDFLAAGLSTYTISEVQVFGEILAGLERRHVPLELMDA